jgi:hypothetical protein
MPIYSSTGAFNVAVNDTTGKGRYSASGALRINLVTGSSYVGLYAADGALNVVDVGSASINTYGGLYHPSGAIRGRTAPTTYSGIQAPDGSYYFSGLFTPLSLFAAGEQGAWYDPSDFSTMFQNSTGTTPVTAVDQPVGLIRDKSGRGNHASQSTEASRPILKVDENGRYYLFFDGTDDFLTNAGIDFSATDKISVFSGMRILQETTTEVILEISFATSVFSGSFAFVNDGAAGSRISYNLKGSGSIAARTDTSSSVAPVTNVISVVYDLAQSTRETEISPRVNGVVPTLVGAGAANAGSGNFGNYPLFIGRRAGITFPFNGRFYSLIILGASASASQITSTETWVNGKTGAY